MRRIEKIHKAQGITWKQDNGCICLTQRKTNKNKRGPKNWIAPGCPMHDPMGVLFHRENGRKK